MAKRTGLEAIADQFAPMIVEAIGADTSDPIQRAMLYETAQPVVRKVIAAALAQARADAVKEARNTRTVAQVAAELGVTPARVYQIMDAGR